MVESPPPGSPPLIEVRGIGKRYTRGPGGGGQGNLKEAVSALFSRGHEPDAREFWALRGVTFSVPAGECIGLVGRNGSGKSTLLTVLARVPPPTEGEAVLRGRVAALLEVGTGFHPELTGRENVYLNGAILGLSRRDITERFDEIVSFADIGSFLDTPVKHYSSGMYLRLAFAVAMSVTPEVLFIDEVLAVGDQGFITRCLEKLDAMRAAGTTILLTSHIPAVIDRLCDRAIYLRGGVVAADGPVAPVMERYYTDLIEGEQRRQSAGASPG
ncbi:MAG: ABC transporter ATP-binding protein [Dehalococcoidia bacterium]|nr:ABC transporter ATP-binding protein [Dehalococcoidia bacterium]